MQVLLSYLFGLLGRQLNFELGFELNILSYGCLYR